MNSTLGLVGGIVLGVLLGAAGVWFYFDSETDGTANPPVTQNGKVTPTPSPTPTPTPEDNLPAVQNSSVTADDQQAGGSVIVRTIRIESTGWVVVYESRGGQPGNALGAARVNAGTHENIAVELLRATIPGQTYFVVLHRDDGNKTFELRNDFPFRGEEGPLMDSFMTNQ